MSCADCYIKGKAHASLVVDEDFNVTTAFKGFIKDFGKEIVTITNTTWHTFDSWVKNTTKEAVTAVGTDLTNFFTGNCTMASIPSRPD